MQNRELVAILIIVLTVIALGLAGNEDTRSAGMSRVTKEEATVRHQQDRDDAAAMSLFGMGEKR